MIRLSRRLAVAVAAFGLLTAGCNGTSYNNPPTSPCVLPTGLQASLVFPAPNSTGNNTSLAQVIVATTGPLPSNWSASWDVVLVFPFSTVYGSTRYGATFQPASPPFPTPNQTPSFSNPSYYQSAFSYVNVPPLPPSTVISVGLNDTSSSCTGVTIANFST